MSKTDKEILHGSILAEKGDLLKDIVGRKCRKRELGGLSDIQRTGFCKRGARFANRFEHFRYGHAF